MDKFIMKKIVVAAVLLVSLSCALSASANRSPFQAVPVLPENQISKSAFFDIEIAHNHTQDLYVALKNDTLEDIDVIINAITATTDSNGRVLYTQEGYSDRSMLYPFDTLINPNPSIVTIPALTEIETSVILNSPKADYDGIILGALHITTKTEAPEAGGIINEFGYALAVRMTAKPQRLIVPNILFEGADFLAGERLTGFMLNIRNIQPELYRNTELTYEITGEGITVFSGSKPIDFAPNSFYPMMLISDSVVMPGRYTATVILKIGTDEFIFQKLFRVLENDAYADSFMDGFISYRRSSPAALSAPTPWWFWLAFGIPVLIALILLIIIIYFRRKRRKKAGAATGR
jgi:hypothetical protein